MVGQVCLLNGWLFLQLKIDLQGSSTIVLAYLTLPKSTFHYNSEWDITLLITGQNVVIHNRQNIVNDGAKQCNKGGETMWGESSLGQIQLVEM